jgi:hypothetical protein
MEFDYVSAFFALDVMEHRAGIEPANTGFADQRVSHFATGAHLADGLELFAVQDHHAT